MRHQVMRAEPDDDPAIAVALARAFHNDPMFSFVMPHPLRQARGLLRVMAAGVADARRHGQIWVARHNSDIVGAAVWFAPGRHARGPLRTLAQLPRLVPNGFATGRRVPAMLRLLRRIDAAHPPEPHWYLEILGVDPAHQRAGVGRALIEPLLDLCDGEAQPAYLETQKRDNLSWYAHAGFELLEQLDVAGCPPIWTMQREPTRTT
ncbi:MAG: hypothetical protein QOI65_1746 [Thermoleophilaceae bacterium]|nr:hypothetical protein [Thermoleophilaceae bacterium]